MPFPVFDREGKHLIDAHLQSRYEKGKWPKPTLRFHDPRGCVNPGFKIVIEPESFEELAKEMIRTNEDAAIRAFIAALRAPHWNQKTASDAA